MQIRDTLGITRGKKLRLTRLYQTVLKGIRRSMRLRLTRLYLSRRCKMNTRGVLHS